jgi:hypothetical protein
MLILATSYAYCMFATFAPPPPLLEYQLRVPSGDCQLSGEWVSHLEDRFEADAMFTNTVHTIFLRAVVDIALHISTAKTSCDK